MLKSAKIPEADSENPNMRFKTKFELNAYISASYRVPSCSRTETLTSVLKRVWLRHCKTHSLVIKKTKTFIYIYYRKITDCFTKNSHLNTFAVSGCYFLQI